MGGAVGLVFSLYVSDIPVKKKEKDWDLQFGIDYYYLRAWF